MTTFTVGVVNRKGGVGKSTIACALAYQAAALHGRSTLLIDADVDQADASLWMLKGRVERDALESGEVYATAYPALSVIWITATEEIPDLSKYDVVVIDGRPSGAVAGVVLGLADVVIAPYLDQTGAAHARRLGALSEVPVFALQNAILGSSATGKNKRKLLGFDAALRSRKWGKVTRDLFGEVRSAYTEAHHG